MDVKVSCQNKVLHSPEYTQLDIFLVNMAESRGGGS